MRNSDSRRHLARHPVLVTGAAGFIGSHLTERLLESGRHVWGLDNFDDAHPSRSQRQNLSSTTGTPGMHLVEGDVRDGVLLDGLMSDIDFDAVVHLAAVGGTGPSSEDPKRCFETNVMGTLELLEAMYRHGARRLVMASSSSVYGEDHPVPHEESVPADRPATPHAVSKRAAEMLSFSHHRQHGLSVHCLRLSPVYGPRQHPDLPVHRLARHMVDGRVLTLDEEPVARDYVYVSDVVAGLLGSLERITEGTGEPPVFEILNLGGSEPVTQDTLVGHLEGALGLPAGSGRRLYTTTNGRRYGHASHDRARELIGYRPEVDLEEGLQRFAEWFWTQPDVEAAADVARPAADSPDVAAGA